MVLEKNVPVREEHVPDVRTHLGMVRNHRLAGGAGTHGQEGNEA